MRAMSRLRNAPAIRHSARTSPRAGMVGRIWLIVASDATPIASAHRPFMMRGLPLVRV